MNYYTTGSNRLEERSTVIKRNANGEPIVGRCPMGYDHDSPIYSVISGIAAYALFGLVAFMFGKVVGKYQG